MHLEIKAAKRERLEHFRKKVRSGKLIKLCHNADELKAQVLHALTIAFGRRDQEGWVRARNARRMEDLEDITRLQKRVLELEAENTRLRAAQTDPTAPFAQGRTSWSGRWN